MIGPQDESPKQILVKESKVPVYIASIAWSPTSRRVIYSWQTWELVGAQAGISTFDFATRKESDIYSDPNLMGQTGVTSVSWSSDGRLFFRLREPPPNRTYTNVWVLQVDPETGQVKGAPSRVTSGTGFTQDNFRQSVNGNRLIFQKDKAQHTILLAEVKKETADLGPVAALAGDTWNKWDVQWSGDSQSVVYMAYRQGKYVICRETMHTHEVEEVVTDGVDADSSPLLTLDGQWLFYNRTSGQGAQTRVRDLMRMPAGGGPASKLFSGAFSYHCAALSSKCVVLDYDVKQAEFSQLNVGSGRGPVIAQVNDFDAPDEDRWNLSANGERIAYIPTRNGSKIKVLSMEGKETPTIVVVRSHLESLSWAPDNRNLYVTSGSESGFELLRVDLDGKFKSLFKVPMNGGYIVSPVSSPDGRFLAISHSTFELNVTLLENF